MMCWVENLHRLTHFEDQQFPKGAEAQSRDDKTASSGNHNEFAGRCPDQSPDDLTSDEILDFDTARALRP